jgi:hypothetical protein
MFLRLVSIARGEQDYFSKEGIPTAVEGCKSNAMMRCCKDLGVASELWDPRFIRTFKARYGKEVFVEHQVTKRKTKIWLRKVRDLLSTMSSHQLTRLPSRRKKSPTLMQS